MQSEQEMWEDALWKYITCKLTNRPPLPEPKKYDECAIRLCGTEMLESQLRGMYEKLSAIIERGIGPGRDPKPLYILDLVRADELSTRIEATLNEREWRLLRFSLERALESI